jgi:protein TonB
VPTFHDENHTGIHLERVSLQRASLERARQERLPVPPPEFEAQRRRMLVALGILLLALVAVIVKDWDFWFPVTGESPQAIALRKAKAIVVGPSTPAPAPVVHERKPAKTEAPAAPFVATERAALPPLQVEVVAGNRSVSVPANSTAIHVDLASGATGASVTAPPGVGSFARTAGGVQISRQAAQNVEVSVPPDYPLLARQMKVQGAVSLQALIAKDGTIEELHILSGPEILATAAREAVKQWHFKPYLQNGQPVETQARITVNFTISTN